MNKYELVPPRRRKPHWCTKSSTHHQYNNLIKEIKVQTPHQIWCSDVSYIKYRGIFWYLSTIEDIFTRQVLSVQVSKRHTSEVILDIIKRACQNFVPKIFHSDQGTEFMAQKCTGYLESKGTRISVSDTDSPWQNGFQESFFGRFKEEFGDFNRFVSVSELIEEIYSQIRYYNQDRIHTALKMSPAVFSKSYRQLSS
jgi:putative transposase